MSLREGNTVPSLQHSVQREDVVLVYPGDFICQRLGVPVGFHGTGRSPHATSLSTRASVAPRLPLPHLTYLLPVTQTSEGGGSSTEPWSSALPTEPRLPSPWCPLRPLIFLFSLPLSAGSSETSPLRSGPASSGRLTMVRRKEALHAVLAVLALLVVSLGEAQRWWQ